MSIKCPEAGGGNEPQQDAAGEEKLRTKAAPEDAVNVETLMFSLDLHLQQILIAKTEERRVLFEGLTGSCESTLEVDVIGNLKDPAEPVDGLSVTQALGEIVRGTVRLDKIEAVRDNPNIISLKAGTRLRSFQTPGEWADWLVKGEYYAMRGWVFMAHSSRRRSLDTAPKNGVL